MNFNPAPSPRDPQPAGGPSGAGGPHTGSARTGIAGRVEAASKMQAPPPKGRGLVMIILAVVVLAALVWDFMGKGAASRAVGRAGSNAERPSAPPKPGSDSDQGTPSAAPSKGPLQVSIPMGNATLSMSAADAVARFAATSGEEREAFRAQVLEALRKPAARSGRQGIEAFETAARFARGAGPAGAKQLRQLRLLALVALSDDARAPAAILFLKQLPEQGGADTMALLDEVILDPERPLRVRIEAARARSADGRPAELEKLASDPATHPSLVDALGG